MNTDLSHPLRSQIVQSLGLTSITVGISLLSNIPIELYYNFVIEQRHGFNKMTYGLYIIDTIKQTLLTAVIGLPFLAGFLSILDWGGNNFIPYLMAFL